MQQDIFNFYCQSGSGGAIFVGSRRPGMVGGGFLGTLARFALPILRNIGGRVLGVARRVAQDPRQVAETIVDTMTRRSVSPDINKQYGTGRAHQRRRHRRRNPSPNIFTHSKAKCRRV
jgi:hypothetical protein